MNLFCLGASNDSWTVQVDNTLAVSKGNVWLLCPLRTIEATRRFFALSDTLKLPKTVTCLNCLNCYKI